MLKTLEPMPSDRKCYRLIGGVLVQQTVAEVRPAVESNAENLKQAWLASMPVQATECAHGFRRPLPRSADGEDAHTASGAGTEKAARLPGAVRFGLVVLRWADQSDSVLPG